MSITYDEEQQAYIVQLKSRKTPVTISAESWGILQSGYSNWDGAPATTAKLSRRLGLSRRSVAELLRMFDVTHDSPPWPPETVRESPVSDLVNDLLRRKGDHVQDQAEKKELSALKKDAESFRRADLFAKKIAARLKDTSKTYKIRKLRLKDADEPYAAVISPSDFHWGKYGPKYGGDPYDRKVAKERLFNLTETLLNRLARRGKPDKIICALGGDGLHIDNMYSSTTRGTPQDCDGTPEELASSWIELCRDYIDLLRQCAPVDLLVVPGNHDRLTATFLRSAMQGWFSKAKDVKIVNSLSTRQYITYGKSMLAFIHGDEGKPANWPAIIANEQAQMWGKSMYRYIFCGHLHTERDFPVFGGVTCFRLPSLSGADAWTHSKGYKSVKALKIFVVTKTKGVIATEIEPA